ncbi:MAG: hypothetical protein CXZ00_03520 [Acidobacteria bacterium]|nr:MAG: hypothetical protein CXZ00_03520 [Acidobacteriota bacterium]
MYFHECHTDGKMLTGTGCPTSAYNTSFDLSGNAGSGTYLLGEIIADKISLSGNPEIDMYLNPNATYNILKVSLLQ